MIRPLCLTLFMLCLVGLTASAQQADTTAMPQPDFKEVKIRENPIPKKSLILSLALPGAGQVYNGRYWKLPLVYGALGGMVYVIDFNQSRYKRLKTALELKRQNLDHEFSGTGIDSERSLLALRDSYDKNRQLSYFGLFVVYALQAVEAFVDAHLLGFEINEDLSLQLSPQISTNPFQPQQVQPGIHIVLSRRK